MWHFSENFWHCLWKFVTCSASWDIVFKSTLILYSSITSHHFQQILMSQSVIICHEILSTALFSTSQTSKMHCSTTTDRRIISQPPHYMVVGRYQKQNTFVTSKTSSNFIISYHKNLSYLKNFIRACGSNLWFDFFHHSLNAFDF